MEERRCKFIRQQIRKKKRNNITFQFAKFEQIHFILFIVSILLHSRKRQSTNIFKYYNIFFFCRLHLLLNIQICGYANVLVGVRSKYVACWHCTIIWISELPKWIFCPSHTVDRTNSHSFADISAIWSVLTLIENDFVVGHQFTPRRWTEQSIDPGQTALPTAVLITSTHSTRMD